MYVYLNFLYLDISLPFFMDLDVISVISLQSDGFPLGAPSR